VISAFQSQEFGFSLELTEEKINRTRVSQKYCNIRAIKTKGNAMGFKAQLTNVCI